ncbi:MAG: energy transducer TonB [Armatimonadota bacterium]|nr:energy transducer TonB [Armatimonadota bacterium]
MRRLVLLAVLLVSVGCSGIQRASPPPPANPPPLHLPGPTAEEEGDLERAQTARPKVQERRVLALPRTPSPSLRPSEPPRPPRLARRRKAAVAPLIRPSQERKRPRVSKATTPQPSVGESHTWGSRRAGGESASQGLPVHSLARPQPVLAAENPRGAAEASDERPPQTPAPDLTLPTTPSPSPESTPLPSPPPVLLPPRPLVTPHPVHPGTYTLSIQRSDLASEAAIRLQQGRVRVKLLVQVDGTVGTVEVLVSSGVPELDQAAVEALRTWRFEPARQDGTPIPAYYVLWVTFRVEP